MLLLSPLKIVMQSSDQPGVALLSIFFRKFFSVMLMYFTTLSHKALFERNMLPTN